MNDQRLRVLFLCTGNSARSQMAEAILRQLSHGNIEVVSAGSAPERDIHPMARRAIQRLLGQDMANQRPKSFQRFLGEKFDYVITVCDRAAESCPVLPGDPDRIQWSFPDPSAVEGTDVECQHAFDTVAQQLIGRIRVWMSLPAIGGRPAPLNPAEREP